MLYGLVSMGIVAHIHELHFPYLMYGKAVVRVIKIRGHIEYGIEHGGKSFVTSHEMYEAIEIMEHGPGVVQAIAFRKGIAPFQGVKGALETAILILSPHKTCRGSKSFL